MKWYGKNKGGTTVWGHGRGVGNVFVIFYPSLAIFSHKHKKLQRDKGGLKHRPGDGCPTWNLEWMCKSSIFSVKICPNISEHQYANCLTRQKTFFCSLLYDFSIMNKNLLDFFFFWKFWSKTYCKMFFLIAFVRFCHLFFWITCRQVETATTREHLEKSYSQKPVFFPKRVNSFFAIRTPLVLCFYIRGLVLRMANPEVPINLVDLVSF